MGGTPSAPVQVAETNTDEEIAALMMPMYYVENVVVTEGDISHARQSWKIVANGSSPIYKAYKESTGSDVESLKWFSALFYERLFDVNPSARPLFKNSIEVQGRVLIAIISTTLSQLKDPLGFNATLVSLAHVHVLRGVKSTQFGLMGDILFWTLSTTLGALYTDEVKYAWIRIYSRMLKVIIPCMVGDERKALKAAKASAAAAAAEASK